MLEALVGAVIGAIVGGAVTWWVSNEQAKQERIRQVRSVSAALAAEILTLVEMARRNNYEDELRQVAANAGGPGFSGEFDAFFVTASQAYFTVFEANAGDIGKLEPQAAVEVVAFYALARGWLDSLSETARPGDGALSREEVIAHYTFRADVISALCVFGEQLAGRLVPEEVRQLIRNAVGALVPPTVPTVVTATVPASHATSVPARIGSSQGGEAP